MSGKHVPVLKKQVSVKCILEIFFFSYRVSLTYSAGPTGQPRKSVFAITFSFLIGLPYNWALNAMPRKNLPFGRIRIFIKSIEIETNAI